MDVSPSGNGTSTLELKAGVSYGMKHQKPEVEGKLELTQKVFNFQEDQDLRLRVGYDLVTRKRTQTFEKTIGASRRISKELERVLRFMSRTL